jgi:cytochrome c-type biogenesis protein CcmH/NrfG
LREVGRLEARGRTLLNQGQLADAEAQAALREAGRLEARGWTLLNQGQFADAEAAFREAVRLRPAMEI